ncbi:hypothetical protein [Microcoleus sp. FACHB-68]|uniref:hypothetical protein n=1 Tax=Microcoleus sp. FACHB-68 TaxID=2692826 RepID=UPI0016891396|nr:hypothetical protein [Microcoleus sp. FACHB-68]
MCSKIKIKTRLIAPLLNGIWGMGQGCANLKVWALGMGHGAFSCVPTLPLSHSGL